MGEIMCLTSAYTIGEEEQVCLDFVVNIRSTSGACFVTLAFV